MDDLYRGKPVNEMTLDELRKAVRTLGTLLTEQYQVVRCTGIRTIQTGDHWSFTAPCYEPASLSSPQGLCVECEANAE